MNESRQPIRIWEGVYETFEEAQAEGTGFACERWIDRINQQLLKYRSERENHALVMPPRMSDLPFLVALTAAKRIIDFGGSSGWTYEYLQSAMEQKTIDDYVVVEIEDVVRHVQVAFLHAYPVSYVTDLNAIYDRAEGSVFYTNSVLQYIRDDDTWLQAIDRLKPDWLLIEDFMGGDFDEYFSLQNYYESKIPIRFRNRSDFLNKLDCYDLILSKPYAATIMGVIQELPMENFPLNKRVRYGETLLLKKRTRK